MASKETFKVHTLEPRDIFKTTQKKKMQKVFRECTY